MDSDNNAVVKYIPENPGQLLADFAEKRVKEIEAEDKAINDNLRKFERRVFIALGESYYDEDKD